MKALFSLALALALMAGAAAETFRNVEVFGYDGRAESNGITPFALTGSTLSTPQRIEILGTLADALIETFDVDLTRSPITDEEVRAAFEGLKPRPLPEVRREIDLVDWSMRRLPPGYDVVFRTGLEPGEESADAFAELHLLREGEAMWGVGSARVAEDAPLTTDPLRIPLSPDTYYRLRFRCRALQSPPPGATVRFMVESPAPEGGRRLRVGSRRWRDSLGVSGEKVVEFRTGLRDDWQLAWSADKGAAWAIDDIELSKVTSGLLPQGWADPGYDDRDWRIVSMPGTCNGEETTLLRTRFEVTDGRRVHLYSAGIQGPFVLWLNGRAIYARQNPQPFTLDITSLVPPGENHLALLCAPAYRGQGPSGRITVIDGAATFLNHLYVSTESLTGDSARLRFQVLATNISDRDFRGSIALDVFPWLPEESDASAGHAVVNVRLGAGEAQTVSGWLDVPRAALWTPDSPAMYRAHAVLRAGGEPVDDTADSFGIRTIEQREGEILLNGRRIVLRGALSFSCFPPLSDADGNAYVPPREMHVRDVLLLKHMNANTLRWTPTLGTSAIDYETKGYPSNDEMIPAVCDQLGMMMLYGAGFWVWQGDHAADWREWFDEAIPPAVRLMRNHPSIVVWEAGNENWHGGRYIEQWSEWWDHAYNLIAQYDDSRLILPSSYGLATRQIEAAAAGGETPGLPETFRAENAVWDVHFYPGWYEEIGYLLPRSRDHWLYKVGENGPAHRPFIFAEYGAEAMPLWDLYDREPWNLRWVHWDNGPMGRFEERNVGRAFTMREVKLSQAYQALALQFVTTMGRQYNVDGMLMCGLTDSQRIDGTYHKGTCDVYRIPKLGWYALGMSFQDVYVTGTRGDMMLGSGDVLHPIVFNAGEARELSGTLVVQKADGTRVAERRFGPLKMEANASAEPFDDWQVDFPEPGIYVLKVEVER